MLNSGGRRGGHDATGHEIDIIARAAIGRGVWAAFVSVLRVELTTYQRASPEYEKPSTSNCEDQNHAFLWVHSVLVTTADGFDSIDRQDGPFNETALF